MPAAAPVPLKIVIAGDGGVGKSCLTMALLNRPFSEEYDPTVEDAYSLSLNVDGVEYAIEIIDTAGQEEYRSLWSETSAREGDGFILTYAINSSSSYELVPNFLHIIRKVKSPDDIPSSALTPENTPFPFLLVGNKCDLPPTAREVSAQQGLTLARQAGGLFSEVSARNRVNVDASFALLIRSVARAKALHQEHVARLGGPGADDGLFNANIALLDRPPPLPGSAPLSPRGSISGVTYEEKARPKKRNPDLAMDRRRSLSVGGLGRDPSTLGQDSHGKGCGCVVS
ncbi:hypothetical protein JCM10207_003329 [Rhodosporidiobolus poonsookiae]